MTLADLAQSWAHLWQCLPVPASFLAGNILDSEVA
jgi:hypothetical protein